jgi:thiazole synthase
MTYKIADKTFNSRLMLGSGKYASFEQMKAAHEASGTEVVTVAIRRVKLDGTPSENILNYIDRKKYMLLPNTAGCYNPKDAILTANLAREALSTNWVKLEVIGSEKTLFPDNEGLLEAAKVLVKEGFLVLPYCGDDPIVCKKLEDIGCPAVMPLAAPIGSGLGIRNPTNIRIILESVQVPVIIDAGVGCSSDVAIAMELGCTAVLMNTGIASAKDPVKMAAAMKYAVEAGRLSFEAGRIEAKLYASASSPTTGRINT